MHILDILQVIVVCKFNRGNVWGMWRIFRGHVADFIFYMVFGVQLIQRITIYLSAVMKGLSFDEIFVIVGSFSLVLCLFYFILRDAKNEKRLLTSQQHLRDACYNDRQYLLMTSFDICGYGYLSRPNELIADKSINSFATHSSIAYSTSCSSSSKALSLIKCTLRSPSISSYESLPLSPNNPSPKSQSPSPPTFPQRHRTLQRSPTLLSLHSINEGSVTSIFTFEENITPRTDSFNNIISPYLVSGSAVTSESEAASAHSLWRTNLAHPTKHKQLRRLFGQHSLYHSHRQLVNISRKLDFPSTNLLFGMQEDPCMHHQPNSSLLYHLLRRCHPIVSLVMQHPSLQHTLTMRCMHFIADLVLTLSFSIMLLYSSAFLPSKWLLNTSCGSRDVESMCDDAVLAFYPSSLSVCAWSYHSSQCIDRTWLSLNPITDSPTNSTCTIIVLYLIAAAVVMLVAAVPRAVVRIMLDVVSCRVEMQRSAPLVDSASVAATPAQSPANFTRNPRVPRLWVDADIVENERLFRPLSNGGFPSKYLYCDSLPVQDEARIIIAGARDFLCSGHVILPWKDTQLDVLELDVLARKTAVMTALGVDSCGTPLHNCEVHVFCRRLRTKLVSIRATAQQLCETIAGYASSGPSGKLTSSALNNEAMMYAANLTLLQNFIVERIPATYRYSLKSTLFKHDCSPQRPVSAACWNASFTVVCVTLVAVIYGAYAARISMINDNVDRSQTSLLREPRLILVIFFVLDRLIAPAVLIVYHSTCMVHITPQLYRIYQVLCNVIDKVEEFGDACCTSYAQLHDDIRVIQHLSPACRAARKWSHLSMSSVLLLLDDHDNDLCVTASLPSTSLTFRMFAAVVLMLRDVPAIIADTALTLFLSILVLAVVCANVMFVAFSAKWYGIAWAAVAYLLLMRFLLRSYCEKHSILAVLCCLPYQVTPSLHSASVEERWKQLNNIITEVDGVPLSPRRRRCSSDLTTVPNEVLQLTTRSDQYLSVQLPLPTLTTLSERRV